MPTDAKKKKLIRIALDKNFKSSPYSYKLSGTGMHYAFAGPNEETNKDGLKLRRQVSTFVTCREYLCSIPRSMVHPIDNSYIERTKVDFDFDKLRLIIGMGAEADFDGTRRKLFSGKRALNMFEEAAGWSTQSVITTIKHEQYDSSRIWLLTGPKEWLHSPQLLSLSGLIMRLAHKAGPLRTDSMKELEDHFAEIANGGFGNDSGHISGVRRHIIKIMTEYKKLFPGKREERWPKGPTGWNGYGGITTMMQCGTGDEALNSRVKNILLKKK